MNKRKVTVSIGIPAYNEEANIKTLLLSLFTQKRSNYVLKEIIVVSDKSTDNTIDEVRSIRNSKIKLVENKKRVGQAGGQNKVIEIFTGDILVLLNADVLPSDDTFLSKLVSPLISSKKVGLVGPKIVPLAGQTFFENVINYSISFKDAVFEKVSKGNNLYLCRGAARAFKKDFAKKILWKDSLSEDAFSYLTCITKGYTFKYVPSAILYFKSPDNFADHLSQSARFAKGSEIMSSFWDRDMVERQYAIPKKIVFMTATSHLVKHPVLFCSYVITFFLVKINSRKGDFAKSMWDTSSSSKVLRIT